MLFICKNEHYSEFIMKNKLNLRLSIVFIRYIKHIIVVYK